MDQIDASCTSWNKKQHTQKKSHENWTIKERAVETLYLLFISLWRFAILWIQCVYFSMIGMLTIQHYF